MTVIELRDQLTNLMAVLPNTTNDEIYFYDCDEITVIDDISVEFDLEGEGRYICLK